MRYYEAEEAFGKVISNYPTSEWADRSKIPDSQLPCGRVSGPEYDQGAMQEAKQKFEEFAREHPDAVLSKEAENNIFNLKEKEAASNYKIAIFYEKQKAL